MARKFIAPALADVSQDIAGNIPLDLVQKWTRGKKSKDLHDEIIGLYVVRGTVVSSDSAGLSKLSKEKTLIEVMKLVNFPKEVIFDHGSEIDGRAIGLWTADNTEMFYPAHIDPKEVIKQMSKVQKKLAAFELQIGMAIHAGEFIAIGGGLYGDDADFVENLAENETQGGQILITKATDQVKSFGGAKTKQPKNKNPKHYPYPFSKDFYLDIKNNSLANAKIHAKYAQTKTVVLIKVLHPKEEFLLDELTRWILANSIINRVAETHKVQKIKSNGSLGIFVSDDENQAIEFAKKVKQALKEDKYLANIGLSKGEVFIFDLGNSNFDIAGEPVNIASKLAEDAGAKNTILIEESIKTNVKGKAFKYIISHVEISGIKI